MARTLLYLFGEEGAVMGHPAPAMPPTVLRFYPERAAEPNPVLRFECLLLEKPEGDAKKRSTTLFVSAVVHVVLVALVILVPLWTYSVLPAAGEAARAFFVAPPEAAPPPPPPPPPAAGPRLAKVVAAPVPVPEDAKFVAPIEVPEAILPDRGLDLAGGVEGGVPGGVEGGVPGGVLGGIVGGIAPLPPPPPPPKAVRVGGQIKAPKLLKVVQPVYPDLAAQARLSATIILEALVAPDGQVKSVTVLRGAPLFDEAAKEAVKQWRYQPLLLNGVPTEFILTVTVKFNVATDGVK